ncbi:Poly [ADP-ribose] polymerase 3 [Paramuricea clavata]|uniref:Poly [ADP-ribose] polymerase 3 n=1 Tax=Paramuricea clavata TaxID=317549 RepID=A0A7D9EY66_PARCT|nr:Poly [ADP-ribose] polymerase 3 [Paramuricea clavata]
MQVCKAWKTLLSDKYFWKMYIQRHFDLGIKSDLSNEGPMAEWSRPGDTDNTTSGVDNSWYCYFSEDGEKDDIYVMRPFPSMWNCRVVHPYGLDPFSGDVRSLQGLCRCLEILTYTRSEASRLGMLSGNQCSANEGLDEICAVIFPWDKKELPTPLELVDGVFHFHPEINEYYSSNPRENKLHFHIPRNEHNIDDSDVDYDEDDEDHDTDEKPCLNSIFGMDFPHQDEQWKYEDSRKFYEWLQPIMYPSVDIFVGDQKFNPVAIFMLAQLAPGWVGGALTAATWT